MDTLSQMCKSKASRILTNMENKIKGAIEMTLELSLEKKNLEKKPILLVNFCFLIHFDFSNTRIFSFSVGIKVMNPKINDATVFFFN